MIMLEVSKWSRMSLGGTDETPDDALPTTSTKLRRVRTSVGTGEIRRRNRVLRSRYQALVPRRSGSSADHDLSRTWTPSRFFEDSVNTPSCKYKRYCSELEADEMDIDVNADEKDQFSGGTKQDQDEDRQTVRPLPIFMVLRTAEERLRMLETMLHNRRTRTISLRKSGKSKFVEGQGATLSSRARQQDQETEILDDKQLHLSRSSSSLQQERRLRRSHIIKDSLVLDFSRLVFDDNFAHFSGKGTKRLLQRGAQDEGVEGSCRRRSYSGKTLADMNHRTGEVSLLAPDPEQQNGNDAEKCTEDHEDTQEIETHAPDPFLTDVRRRLQELLRWNPISSVSSGQAATIVDRLYESFVPLPYEPFPVPGGRFREVYYWDSYWTCLGLLASASCAEEASSDRSVSSPRRPTSQAHQRQELTIVENMLRNFAYLVRRFGFIPNGNRVYYLTRSQPPMFAETILLWVNNLCRRRVNKMPARPPKLVSASNLLSGDGAEGCSFLETWRTILDADFPPRAEVRGVLASLEEEKWALFQHELVPAVIAEYRFWMEERSFSLPASSCCGSQLQSESETKPKIEMEVLTLNHYDSGCSAPLLQQHGCSTSTFFSPASCGKPRTECYAIDVKNWEQHRADLVLRGAPAGSVASETSSRSHDLDPGPALAEDRAAFFRSIRATCESGWDFSTRWEGRNFVSDGHKDKDKEDLHTPFIFPCDLNAILHRVELFLSRYANTESERAYYARCAKRRRNAARILLVTPTPVDEDRRFSDYSFAHKTFRTRHLTCASDLWPIWGGLDLPVQVIATGTPTSSSRLEVCLSGGVLRPYTTLQTHPGASGVLFTTTRPAGEDKSSSPEAQKQWDHPNIWPPLQHVASESLRLLRAVESQTNDAIDLLVLRTTHQQDHEQATSKELLRSYLDAIRDPSPDFASHCVRKVWEESQNLSHANYVSAQKQASIYEKYQFRGGKMEGGSGGEYEVQLGFGWTNGVVLSSLNKSSSCTRTNYLA